MKHKLTAFIMMIFMCVSIVSVGFASWTIVYDSEFVEKEGEFTAENIVDYNDYIVMNSVTPLKYNKLGFIGTNNPYVFTMVCEFTVNVSGIHEKFKDVANIQIGVDLKYIDEKPTNSNGEELYNIFKKITSVAYHNKEVITNYAGASNSDENKQEYNSIIPITIELNENKELVSADTYTFTIEYTFTLDESYFNTMGQANSLSPLFNKSYPIFKVIGSLSLL